MARERRLEIVIAGDASGARRAFGQVDSDSDSLGKKLGDFGKKMTLGVTVPAVAAGAALFDMASDMNETLSKSATVFDDHAASIEKWASGAAEDFGQSKKEALDAAATFGNLFDQLDVADKPTAEMSQALTELASDFASFHNADITDVIQAQTAAFRGEFDAIQRFVPTINAAAVEQKAMEMGLAATTDELDAQDKALATYQLLVEGAGEAMGDFDRTADGAANKQRILTAGFKDTATTLAQNLMPIGQRLLDWASRLVGWFNDLSPGTQKLILVMVGLAAAIGPVVTVVGALSTAITFLGANPVVLLIAGIAALAIVVVKNWDTIKGAFMGVFDWVKRNWPTLLAILTGPIGLAVLAISRHWDSIVSTVRGLPGRIASAARGMWDWLVDGFRSVVNRFIRAWNSLGDSLRIRFGGWDPPGPGSIPGFTSPRLLPHINELAHGGVTTGPTLAVVGDNPSGTEAIVPLERANELGFGGGPAEVRVVLDVTGGDGVLKEFIRRAVRVEGGGNVQVAFGQ